jgi:hypothetical protein
MGSSDKAVIWMAGLIVLTVFLFAGTPDIQDALIGFIVNASGGR